MKEKAPLIIIGPSGAGKSTLTHRLLDETGSQLVRTVTTRPARGNDDLSHTFVDEPTFAAMEQRGEFLGSDTVFGHHYGLPKLPTTGRPIVVLLRAPFVGTFRSQYPGTLVVQIEAPVPILLERLEARGDVNRADPAILEAEIIAGRQLADAVVSTEKPIDQSFADLLAFWKSHYPDATS